MLFQDAESLSVQASNLLLKLLEEPPAGVHFILCASSESAILPTIRSRCQLWFFDRLSKIETIEFIQQLSSDEGQEELLPQDFDIDELVKLADGCPGNLLGSQFAREDWEDCEMVLSNFLEEDASELLVQAAHWAKEKETLPERLRLFRQTLHNRLLQEEENYTLRRTARLLRDVDQASYLIFERNLAADAVLASLFSGSLEEMH